MVEFEETKLDIKTHNLLSLLYLQRRVQVRTKLRIPALFDLIVIV